LFLAMNNCLWLKN